MWGGGITTPINKTDTAVDASPDTKTLTTSYANGWVSDWISAPLAQYARLLLTLVNDDATSIELKLEVEDSSGTDGFTTLRVTAGVAEVDEISWEPTADETERVAIQVFVPECRRFRVRAKKTGGTGDVTLTLKYLLDTTTPD